MTAPAALLIDGLVPGKAPKGTPGANGGDAGAPKFAEFLATVETGDAGAKGAPQVVSDVATVEGDNSTTDGPDAALIAALPAVPAAPAAPASPGALLKGIMANPLALLSGGATDLPPGEATMPSTMAASLGANPQGQPEGHRFIMPVDLPQLPQLPVTDTLLPGNIGLELAAGARDAARNAVAGARDAVANAGDAVDRVLTAAHATVENLSNVEYLPNTVAGDAVARASAVLQSLPSTPPSQTPPETFAAPGTAIAQSVVAGLAGGNGQPAAKATKGQAALPQANNPLANTNTPLANTDALAIAHVRVPHVPAPKVAQVAVSIPRPALAGDVAVAATAATPAAQGIASATPTAGTGAGIGAGAIAAAAQSGEPSTAEAVIAALVTGAQTGGRSQEALAGVQENVALNGVGEVRADGPLVMTHPVTGTAPDPAEAALRASREHAAPQPPAEQVAMQLRAGVRNGIDRITIQLKPATLGTIDVRLDIGHDGRVIAVISADRSDTLELLQRDARGLERALQEAGLQTDSGSLSFNLRGEDGYADAQADAQGGSDLDPHNSAGEPEADVPGDALPPVASDRALDIRV